MKIGQYIRDLHASLAETYAQLKTEVDTFMQERKEPSWHYISRLKKLESFALKIETGRSQPTNMDDFLGCTLVVENLGSMIKAEELIRKRFHFHERKPEIDSITSKPPDSFRFDDTRLYVKWKDNAESRPTGLNGLLFEVQIKTFLAHAWSIATHDLTYKTDEKSWPKERIAFQIKAMLEHAELSIVEAQNLAQSSSINKTDDISNKVSQIMNLVKEYWPPEALPSDKKRFAVNIYYLLGSLGIEFRRLKEILNEERRLGRGCKIINLSPYCTIVQSLIYQESKKFQDYIFGPKKYFNIYISCDVQIPNKWHMKKAKNIILDGM